MKTKDLFQGYPFPRTNQQEVLLILILQGYVSIFDFPYLSGFRTRVSELQRKHGLVLTRKKANRNNKFGNCYSYAIHVLEKENKQFAEQLYAKLNA